MTAQSGPPLRTTLRSHMAGSLRRRDVGTTVTLGGWVHRSRDLGGLVFIDLRDRDGLVQVSFNPEWTPAEVIAAAAAVGVESVVLVEGVVAERPAEMRNRDLGTGEIEVRAKGLTVVGPATTPAIPVAPAKDGKLAAEELRLRHRVLDLRRPELARNLELRHRLMRVTRGYLSDEGCLEIETPILTKPTPEGARDFLVPSRMHPGEFFALPQSPQIYKQLFMCCGFDRYFQIARCFRDEDLRADRQLEFTQIDIEASFVTREDILVLAEGLIEALWHEGGAAVERPFPRMTYAEAMERFGCDRPDLRYGLEIADLTPVFGRSESAIIQQAMAAGGRVRGLRVPGGAAWSRKQVDDLEAIAKKAGAGGLVRLKRGEGKLEGPLAKFLDDDAQRALGLADGELLLAVAGADAVSNPALDRVRQECAARLGLIDDAERRFLWVLDFPMFARDAATGALAAVHHPFTSPDPADMAAHPDAPERWRALAYDCVLNGTELGGREH
ncbi:MAG: aspartate--tRNA ligase, partial [Gemmatimonadota bacterium]|nr:aspartate--tRNA ligase [Gemmatimonadota bacterium]